jgi:hypothetical protein
MYDRAWQVPQHDFVAAWNDSQSLDEAAAKIRELAGGTAPRWAVLSRAQTLRKEGVELKAFAKG